MTCGGLLFVRTSRSSGSYPSAPQGSPTLAAVTESLEEARENLWHRRIPEMAGGYFADLMGVLVALGRILRASGRIWMVRRGQPYYGGVSIPVARILEELVPHIGFRVVNTEPFRSMRSSAQQGGVKELDESLLVLEQA